MGTLPGTTALRDCFYSAVSSHRNVCVPGLPTDKGLKNETDLDPANESRYIRRGGLPKP
jgi:hypothetical protein